MSGVMQYEVWGRAKSADAWRCLSTHRTHPIALRAAQEPRTDGISQVRVHKVEVESLPKWALRQNRRVGRCPLCAVPMRLSGKYHAVFLTRGWLAASCEACGVNAWLSRKGAVMLFHCDKPLQVKLVKRRGKRDRDTVRTGRLAT